MKGNHHYQLAGPKNVLQGPQRQTATRPTVSTATALQKKQPGKQQKELEVNQIWYFNSSWEYDILQLVKEKLTTYSAVNISNHYQAWQGMASGR